MTTDDSDILFTGTARTSELEQVHLDLEVQHLGCFAGGMVGVGAKIFDAPDHLAVARKLVNGYIWAYEYMPTSIMPEIFHTVSCGDPCRWDVQNWYSAVAKTMKAADRSHSQPEQERLQIKIQGDRLNPGITALDDQTYKLRCS